MRILQVRFQNLNSLVGEWEVNFTHPAFACDGIFAITGPTGAGKTTILDAICLGLYGRTPRLNKVTKGVNEIMSRQTGECFAEVTFESQLGRYRCHWSQRRARKNPAGELQSPKHEITNADSGNIIETKIKGVATQIEEATGMNFDRFTRSMLLAQGDFAAFLQAAPDERAPILEQITGTEIYSQISIRVYDRRTTERKKLELLQAALAGLHRLSPEEEAHLTQSLSQKTLQDKELTTAIIQHNDAIQWLETITQLQTDLQQVRDEKAELQLKITEFSPQQKRLNQATTALELAGDYADLNAVRKAQQSDQQSKDQYLATLPDCLASETQAITSLNVAADQLAQLKEEQNQSLQTIRKVRELDINIEQKNAALVKVHEIIAETTLTFTTLTQKLTSDSNATTNKQLELAKLGELVESYQQDELLVAQLAGLRAQFDNLIAIKSKLDHSSEEADAIKKRHQADKIRLQQLGELLQLEENKLAPLKQQLDSKELERQTLLEQKDLAHWREQQKLSSQRENLISQTLKSLDTQLKSEEANRQIEQHKTTLYQQQEQLRSNLATETQRQESLENELALLENQLTLLRRIDDLESARQQLRDGEDCPLCGSPDHPYASGNVPKANNTQLQLNSVRVKLKSLSTQMAAIRVSLAKVESDLEHAIVSQQAHVGTIQETSDLVKHHCAELSMTLETPTSTNALHQTFQQLHQQVTTELTYCTATVENAEKIEHQLKICRETYSQHQELVVQCNTASLTAKHQHETSTNDFQRLRNEASKYEQQLATLIESLLQEVKVFGVHNISVAHANDTMDQLTVRRDQWIFRSNQKLELEQAITELMSKANYQREQLVQLDAELKKHQRLQSELQEEKNALSQERRAIFGDKDASHEESRIASTIDAAERLKESARESASLAKTNLSNLNTKITSLNEAIANRGIQLQSLKDAFDNHLTALGFNDEEHYRASCLAEDERKELKQMSQHLADDVTRLNAKDAQTSTLLASQRNKNITTESLPNLKEAMSMLVNDQRSLQQDLGGIRAKLSDNEILKQRQQEQFDAVDSQQRECARWDLLHELIGSADGKKYRNFAQGLTFELMIGHTNKQLQKMTDRYVLMRDRDQPLELNVIDNYQAGEIRSTQNLSGGESFIVSLALALGLSTMASKQVRVDSLFLDEGFGTLDEEALETALATLSGLQQEGKLIGVISHVAALKERISTQIQVSPSSGGRSQITGPGCATKSCSTLPTP